MLDLEVKMSENKERSKTKKQKNLAPLPHQPCQQQQQQQHHCHHTQHQSHYQHREHAGHRVGARNSLKDLFMESAAHDDSMSRLDCCSVLPPINTPCPPLQSRSFGHTHMHTHQAMDETPDYSTRPAGDDVPLVRKDSTGEQRGYGVKLLQKGWRPDVPRVPKHNAWENLTEFLSRQQQGVFTCAKVTQTKGGIAYDLLPRGRSRHVKSKRSMSHQFEFDAYDAEDDGGLFHKPVNAAANALARVRLHAKRAQLSAQAHNPREVTMERCSLKMRTAEKNRLRLREKKLAKIRRSILKRKALLQVKRVVSEGASSVPVLPSVGPDHQMTAGDMVTGKSASLHQLPDDLADDLWGDEESMDADTPRSPC